MSDDFPTHSEIGEQNIRERNKRLGLRYHVPGTPMVLIELDKEDDAPAGGGWGA